MTYRVGDTVRHKVTGALFRIFAIMKDRQGITCIGIIRGGSERGEGFFTEADFLASYEVVEEE